MVIGWFLCNSINDFRSKDNTAKLIDIRKVENNLITWKKSSEINSVCWHPH